MSPLEGIVIVDLTRLLPGAVASMMLGDAGAEIIRVLQPGSDDLKDHVSMLFGESFARFTDRTKQKVTIDLKTDHGRDELLKLVEKADVLMESFRPDVMKKLGIDYDSLCKINPRLIYCSITGYGENGPNRNKAGHDLNFIAMAGLLGNPPFIPPYQIADLAGGSLNAIINILLAIIQRSNTGRGGEVNISMTDTVSQMMIAPHIAQLSKDSHAMRGIRVLSGSYACYNIYETTDNRYLAVAALEPKFWNNICQVIQRADLIDSQYIDDRQKTLIEEMKGIFKSKTSDEWVSLFDNVDACLTPVNEKYWIT